MQTKRQIKKISTLIMISLFLVTLSKAQNIGRTKLSLTYNTATPLGSSFKDYVNKTSFRGFQGSVLYDATSAVRVGVQFGYNDFYEKIPRKVYKLNDGSDISAVLSNTLENVPLLVKGEYSLSTNGIKPYVGLGAGIGFINYSQYYGELLYKKSYVKGAFSGDLGVIIPFKSKGQSGARISTSYNFSPFNEEGIKNISTWNVQAGVVFPLK